MKFLFYFVVIAIIYSLPVFADNAAKVKLIKSIPVFASKEYFNLDTFKLGTVKGNATYNHLVTEFDVIKDIPLDTQYVVEVYQSKSGCESYKKINVYTASFCTHDNDKYDAYLSNAVSALKAAGKCVPKGHYRFDDVGFFAFYELLSEEQLKDSCFKTISNLTSGGKSFYTVELEFVSNQK